MSLVVGWLDKVTLLRSPTGNISLDPFSGSSEPDEELDLVFTTLVLEIDLDLDTVLDLDLDTVLDLVLYLVVDLDLDLVLLTLDFLEDLDTLDRDSHEDSLFRELVLDLVSGPESSDSFAAVSAPRE